MDKKIAFVYDKLHPLHNRLLKSIDCDFTSLSKKIPRNYDIYVVEGTYLKPILLKKLGRINKEKKIVTLFSDPRLFYLHLDKKFDFKKEKMVKYPKWRSIIAKKFIKELDGAISIGDFSAGLFRKFNKKSPIINVPAFIFKEKQKTLTKINPNLSNHNLLFIGHGPDYHVKGIDLLIEVFKDIKNKFPDTKLYILGKWNVRKEWKTEGVHFEGTKDIVPYLKKSSLSIHLGRGESFGINILEAMLAGIPTIVSKYTGAKQAVKEVDKNMILPLKKEVIFNEIHNYFNLNLREKKELSKRCKNVAKEFNEEKILKTFKKKFQKFIKELYKNENSHHK